MAESNIELRHLNVVVRDLDASWSFYRDVLGFKYLYHSKPNKIVASFNDFEFFLEQADDWAPANTRYHFGLRTDPDGVRKWKARLEEHGVPLVKGNNATADIEEDTDSNRVALYFQDPDGTTIEIYSPE